MGGAQATDPLQVLADIARQLQAEPTADKTYTAITSAAVATIDGCDHASISIIRRQGGIDTIAATDDVGRRVDAIQYEVGQGPCLEAIAKHSSYLITDLAIDERWPLFSHRAAAETGVHSMLSFGLFVQEDTLGALNLFSRAVAAFDAHAQAVGVVLAAHAALAVIAGRDKDRAANLEVALRSSRKIGVAMGIIMTRLRVTEDETFDVLRRASQSRNMKLREVADSVIATGQLPD